MIAQTNILWPIQIVSNPWNTTYFTNMNTAAKLSYFMPIMEKIEIYFTDIWDDLMTDIIEFQLVLTFDFANQILYLNQILLNELDLDIFSSKIRVYVTECEKMTFF